MEESVDFCAFGIFSPYSSLLYICSFLLKVKPRGNADILHKGSTVGKARELENLIG